MSPLLLSLFFLFSFPLSHTLGPPLPCRLPTAGRSRRRGRKGNCPRPTFPFDFSPVVRWRKREEKRREAATLNSARSIRSREEKFRAPSSLLSSLLLLARGRRKGSQLKSKPAASSPLLPPLHPLRVTTSLGAEGTGWRRPRSAVRFLCQVLFFPPSPSSPLLPRERGRERAREHTNSNIWHGGDRAGSEAAGRAEASNPPPSPFYFCPSASSTPPTTTQHHSPECQVRKKLIRVKRRRRREGEEGKRSLFRGRTSYSVSITTTVGRSVLL